MKNKVKQIHYLALGDKMVLQGMKLKVKLVYMFPSNLDNIST